MDNFCLARTWEPKYTPWPGGRYPGSCSGLQQLMCWARLCLVLNSKPLEVISYYMDLNAMHRQSIGSLTTALLWPQTEVLLRSGRPALRILACKKSLVLTAGRGKSH
jgi:hypothetical protein